MTKFLALVSKPEIGWKISRACLKAQDWEKEIPLLVWKHKIERKKISISSRSMRLEERNVTYFPDAKNLLVSNAAFPFPKKFVCKVFDKIQLLGKKENINQKKFTKKMQFHVQF